MDTLARTVLRLDLFPARVTVLGTSYTKVRATITGDGELQVWRLGPSGPERMSTYPITGTVAGKLSIGYDVPSGDVTVRLEQDGGCACGSALGTADLYPGSQVVVVGMLG